MTAGDPHAEVARRFAIGDDWFEGSPLYQALARVVAADPELVALAAQSRAGQHQPNLLMGAVQYLVLRDPELPLARFFASVDGDAARDPAGAGPVFTAFCREHREALLALVRTRLVQTNAAGRGTALRLAMHVAGRRVGGPVNLLEIGSSAGIQLRFDAWGADVGGRSFGPPDAALRLRSAWRADTPPPDLDELPPIPRRLGVDLDPVDATDPDARAWLRALIWPEDHDRAAQLEAALDVVAADPPEILRGDAVDLLPAVDASLPDDVPVLVWHSAVRMHVPAARRPAFDAAIAALGARRRLLHVAFEMSPRSRELGATGPAFLLSLTDSGGHDAELALGHGHGKWLQPIDPA